MIVKITIALIAATVAFIIGVRMIAQRAPRPDRLGVVSGKLLPCPDTPNCVSSIEGALPYTYSGNRSDSHTALLATLREWPRTTIVQSTDEYIHVEFRSRVFNFIDDGEFYLPSDQNVIHYRSAARMGRSDLSANGTRAKEIGIKLTEALQK